MPRERFVIVVMLGLTAITLGVHVLATFDPLVPWMWGVHAYAFFPRGWLLVAVAAVVAALVAMVGLRPPRFAIPGGRRAPAWRPWALYVAVAAGAFAVFWLLRARHLFLGDGFVLVDSIPRTDALHNFEPLMAHLQHAIWRLAGPLFQRPGSRPADVAAATTALGSAVAGVLFVLTLIPLSAELLRAASRDAVARADVWTRAGIVVVIASQGFVQLFFGYVENYTWLALAVTYYLLTAFAYLNGRASLLPALVSCCAALCLHLSAAALLPSLTVLVAWGFLDARRRRALLGDLVSGVVLVVVLAMLISMAGNGYDLPATLWQIARLVLSGSGDTAGYLLSARHLQDFLNEVALVGPLGMLLFVVLLGGMRWVGRPGIARVFVGVLGLTWLAGVWVAGDSNLGYARNWDLLAPAGLVFAVAGVFLLLELAQRGEVRRLALGIAVAASLFHTAPWIALNASFERSFERFKTLPLGGGRTESTVGYWYATHGQLDAAEQWLIRALDANPGNSRAHYLLGRVCMMTGRYDEAVAAFSAARIQRPDLEPFRMALIDALVRTNHGSAALAEVDTLIARNPGVARDWAVRGVILMELNKAGEARDAVARAIALDPADNAYRDIERQLDAPGATVMLLGGTATVLGGRWQELMDR